MKQLSITSMILFCSWNCFAQIKTDSIKKLNEVIIRPYFSPQPLLRSTGTIGLINQQIMNRQPSGSLVSSVNTLPGLRMEERSPGSYRLSIRGSLLRSPFGIRNVKIYFDDFPLTDAGGNSYLNALDVAAVGSLQVLKGPQASAFGANSGGVILIQPAPIAADSTLASVKLEGSSFGGFHQTAMLNHQIKKYSFQLTQAYQRSDGFRDHSAMDRSYLQLLQKLTYTDHASAKAVLFYSDLHYDTPGGLTKTQFDANPRASRPATPATKSAIEQQAGIYSRTIYGGLSNEWVINQHLKHVAAVFSTYTDFKNPFITNYEKRKEFTIGVRSYLEYAAKRESADYQLDLGLESMQTNTGFDNYDNNYGTPAAVQASDKLKAASNFAFVHLNIDVLNKLLIELSASANLYKYHYKSLAPILIAQKSKSFDIQLMPRLGLSYLLSNELSIRASASKGYSPPTLSEVRASNNVINIDLEPEKGWNYETGLRFQAPGSRFSAEATGFNYNLKHAIVRRMDQNVTEYFVNAGGTRQWGLETSFSYWLIASSNSGIIRGLQLRNSYTLSKFKFDAYLNNTDNFSGNALTGVPRSVVISSAEAQFPKGFYVFFQHNYTSGIPLNDANTVYAKKYHLAQAKIGWTGARIGRVPLELFAGADNLLNQKYSLGNDLNANGSRYFNAAATRNFYGGLSAKFGRK